MPVLAVTLDGRAMRPGPEMSKSETSRTPVQATQLWQFEPGRKFWPMQPSRVSRKANVSPTASPEPWSLAAAPPVLVSMPWPHSWRKTAAISPVFEQPPPER